MRTRFKKQIPLTKRCCLNLFITWQVTAHEMLCTIGIIDAVLVKILKYLSLFLFCLFVLFTILTQKENNSKQELKISCYSQWNRHNFDFWRKNVAIVRNQSLINVAYWSISVLIAYAGDMESQFFKRRRFEGHEKYFNAWPA